MQQMRVLQRTVVRHIYIMHSAVMPETGMNLQDLFCRDAAV